MTPMALFVGGTFLLICAVMLVPYYFYVLRPESAARESLQARMRTLGATTAAAKPGAPGVLREVEHLSTFGPLNHLLQGSDVVTSHIRALIAQSGLKITPGRALLGSGCLALLADLVVVLLWKSPLLAFCAAVVAGSIPYVVLRIIRSRRMDKFEEFFPEAVDLIARTIRAGHAFSTGLRMAADEVPEPVAGEFRLLHDQQNYGLPINEGLKNLAVRVPIIDARFFVTAVLTQREAGGNLAEVLDNLSQVIRERFRIKRQLRVLSARGRLTGVILGTLPPAIGLMMLIRVPDHFGVLVNSPLGLQMIYAALALQIIGAYMIHKITDVNY